jgi:hypothetical protein
MVWKLARAFVAVTWKQLFSDAAYDLSFRIMSSVMLLSSKPRHGSDRSTP